MLIHLHMHSLTSSLSIVSHRHHHIHFLWTISSAFYKSVRDHNITFGVSSPMFFTFSFVSFYSEMICIQFFILPRIKGAFLTVLCFNKLFSRYECQGKGRLKIRVIIIITTLMGTGCSSRILVLQVNFILVKNVGLWGYLHQLSWQYSKL